MSPTSLSVSLCLSVHSQPFFISSYRYLDLTEEEKEKLRGSQKVAKKLEKLENMGQNQ